MMRLSWCLFLTHLLVFVQCNVQCNVVKHNLKTVCKGMNCQWMGPAFYTGCLPPDQDILKFPFFDSDSVLDLRCTHVRSVFIENSPSICSDIDILTTQGKSFSLFIDDKLCSVDGAQTMLTTEVTPASTGSSNTLQEVDVETSVRMESMMTTKTTASTVTTRMLSEPTVTTKPLQAEPEVETLVTGKTESIAPTLMASVNTEQSQPAVGNNKEVDISGGLQQTLLTMSIISTCLTSISIIVVVLICIIRYCLQHRKRVRTSVLPKRVERMRQRFDEMHEMINRVEEREF